MSAAARTYRTVGGLVVVIPRDRRRAEKDDTDRLREAIIFAHENQANCIAAGTYEITSPVRLWE